MGTSPNKQRTAFLKLLYNKSGGSQHALLDLKDLRKLLGVSEEEAVKIVDYLKSEGLIEASAIGDSLGITHLGIKFVEQRRYFWNAWSMRRVPRFLILSLISWAIGQLLNREVPTVLNVITPTPSRLFGAGAGQHGQPTATLQTTIPVWLGQLVAFVVAIPLLYIVFSLLFHDGHLTVDAKSLVGALIFSAAGIFVFSAFIL